MAAKFTVTLTFSREAAEGINGDTLDEIFAYHGLYDQDTLEIEIDPVNETISVSQEIEVKD